MKDNGALSGEVDSPSLAGSGGAFPLRLTFLLAALLSTATVAPGQEQATSPSPPHIQLHCEFGNHVLLSENLHLSGRVTVSDGTAAVMANGTPLEVYGEGYWRVFLPLETGGNRIVLGAQGAQQQFSERILQVTRAESLPPDIPEAIRLLVLDLNSAGADPLWAEIQSENLVLHLGNSPLFRLVDRNSFLETLGELELQIRDLTSEATMLRVGRVLVADYALAGSLEVTDQRPWLNARLLDVAAGEIVWTCRYPLKALDLEECGAVARALSLDLERLLAPRPVRIVDTASCPVLYLDQGGLEGLRSNLRVLEERESQLALSGRIRSVYDHFADIVVDATRCPMESGGTMFVLGALNLPARKALPAGKPTTP